MSTSISPHLRILSDKLPLDILKYVVQPFLLPAERKQDSRSKLRFCSEVQSFTICSVCYTIKPSSAIARARAFARSVPLTYCYCKDRYAVSLDKTRERNRKDLQKDFNDYLKQISRMDKGYKYKNNHIFNRLAMREMLLRFPIDYETQWMAYVVGDFDTTY